MLYCLGATLFIMQAVTIYMFGRNLIVLNEILRRIKKLEKNL